MSPPTRDDRQGGLPGSPPTEDGGRTAELDRDAAPPEPDEPTDDLERARARAFAKHLDTLLAGEDLPPALSADQRALVDAASSLRTLAEGALSPERQARVIEGALAARLGSGADAARPRADRVPTSAARSRRGLRWALPYAAAAMAAAMAAFLASAQLLPPRVEVSVGALRPELTSRPADPLVGIIERDRAADARARADTIFADRLHGYRELAWLERGGGDR
jgi:hypothetical protein